MIDVSEFCDLLIVEADNKRHVVKAPAHKANVGDFVSFTDGSRTVMGKVVDKMWCEKGGDAYRCFSCIAPIRQAKKIYYPKWERENN